MKRLRSSTRSEIQKYWNPIFSAGFLSLLILSAGGYYFYPDLHEWLWYFYYMTISNSFIAIPHEPVVMYFGRVRGALLPAVWAVFPTLIGCYLDYAVLAPLMTTPWAEKLKRKPVSQKVIGYFATAPFITLAVVAATPIPFYPVRILSVASDYSVFRYMGAVLAGRFPRYVLIAAGGYYLQISNSYLIVFLIILLTWYTSVLIHNTKLRKQRGNSNVS